MHRIRGQKRTLFQKTLQKTVPGSAPGYCPCVLGLGSEDPCLHMILHIIPNDSFPVPIVQIGRHKNRVILGEILHAKHTIVVNTHTITFAIYVKEFIFITNIEITKIIATSDNLVVEGNNCCWQSEYLQLATILESSMTDHFHRRETDGNQFLTTLERISRQRELIYGIDRRCASYYYSIHHDRLEIGVTEDTFTKFQLVVRRSRAEEEIA